MSSYREVDAKGNVFWYKLKTREKHKENGPAVIQANGNKYYYQNDLLHREDGPAIELNNGDKKYYQHGKLHRLDGPAIELTDGNVEYWIYGKRLTYRAFVKIVSCMKVTT